MFRATCRCDAVRGKEEYSCLEQRVDVMQFGRQKSAQISRNESM
jgi:hypothetical protein